jgi:hypothetical protein
LLRTPLAGEHLEGHTRGSSVRGVRVP